MKWDTQTILLEYVPSEGNFNLGSYRLIAVNQVRRSEGECSNLWRQDTQGQEEREHQAVCLGTESFHSTRMGFEGVGVASQESEEINLFNHRRSLKALLGPCFQTLKSHGTGK